MAKDDRRPRVKAFDRAKIAALAQSISEISTELQAFSDALGLEGFDGQLSVDGGAKVYEAQDWIITWLAGLKLAKRRIKLPTGTDGGESEQAGDSDRK